MKKSQLDTDPCCFVARVTNSSLRNGVFPCCDYCFSKTKKNLPLLKKTTTFIYTVEVMP